MCYFLYFKPSGIELQVRKIKVNKVHPTIKPPIIATAIGQRKCCSDGIIANCCGSAVNTIGQSGAWWHHHRVPQFHAALHECPAQSGQSGSAEFCANHAEPGNGSEHACANQRVYWNSNRNATYPNPE